MFLKNRNISSKIKRSKVTDYAALTSMINTTSESLKILAFQILWAIEILCSVELIMKKSCIFGAWIILDVSYVTQEFDK